MAAARTRAGITQVSALTLEVEVDGKLRRIALERKDEGYIAHFDGHTVPIDLCQSMPGVLSLLIGDGPGGDNDVQRSYRCIRTAFADEEVIALIGSQHRVAVTDPRSLRAQRKGPGAGNGKVQIKSSMPGRVARVLVTPGEEVDAQQGIVVVEAMKMQNELKSPRPARVAEVRVTAGDKVAAGQVLAVLD
jgi:biotin carboxyl carrier protein